MVDETEKHFLNYKKKKKREKGSDNTVGAILFTTIYIIIATAWIFFWCTVTELSL